MPTYRRHTTADLLAYCRIGPDASRFVTTVIPGSSPRCVPPTASSELRTATREKQGSVARGKRISSGADPLGTRPLRSGTIPCEARQLRNLFSTPPLVPKIPEGLWFRCVCVCAWWCKRKMQWLPNSTSFLPSFIFSRTERRAMIPDPGPVLSKRR